MIFQRKMIDCHKAANHLHELLDGELKPGWEKKVRRHLKACSHCASLYEFEKTFCRFFKQRGQNIDIPENLTRDLLNKLDRDTTSEKP